MWEECEGPLAVVEHFFELEDERVAVRAIPFLRAEHVFV